MATEESTGARARKLEELLEISAVVNSRLETGLVLESMVLSALALLRADSAEVWAGTSGRKGASFRLLKAAGSADQERPAQVLKTPPDLDGPGVHGKLAGALRTALPFPGYDPAVVAWADFDLGARQLGLFTVSREESRPFNEEDQYFLRRLARLAGTALVNSRAVEDLRRERDQALQVSGQGPRHGIVGESLAVRQLADLIERVGPSQAGVLIVGERGTGKELVADALHKASDRSTKPFVKVNCAGLVESLLASELFGHEQGAFTGAEQMRRGLFEQVDGGTIFLDEIGEMPDAMQVQLLRVLQSGSFRRVGGDADLTVDVRVIAATNRRIDQASAAEGFRRDLYDRLSTVVLHTPPLRERQEDIVHLTRFFLRRYAALEGRSELATFAPEVLKAMESRPWPGNIRELEKAVHRMVILCPPGERIEADALDLIESVSQREASGLPASAAGSAAASAAPATAVTAGDHPPQDLLFDGSGRLKLLRDARTEFETLYVRSALAANDGNISRAAAQAGIDRGNFKIKMRKFGISRP